MENEPVPPIYYSNDPLPSDTGMGISNNFGGALETVNNYTMIDLVQLFIVYAFIIVGALAAIFIFVGGVSFILSGGNDEKIKSAVNTIRYSIVGLIVTILSFTFVMIVGRIFGLNLLNYISYEQIKCSINRLVEFGEDPTNSSCQQYLNIPRR
ncbi:pilin [Candidatus Gracilibacteria bacterium]|nr:pilin [Candidatus Gracilibacteria bacterium]MCF7819062.1 pilin [Candidatus Gracilibacteria bacterium]